MATIDRVKDATNADARGARRRAHDVRSAQQPRAPGRRGSEEALLRLRLGHPAQRAPLRGAVARQARAPLRRAVEGRAGLPLARARADPCRLAETEGAAPRSGMGLDALLPVGAAEGRPRYGDKSVFSCPIESIVPQKGQPRQHFDAKALEELARSIREHGLLEPLVVRRMPRQRPLRDHRRRAPVARVAEGGAEGGARRREGRLARSAPSSSRSSRTCSATT